MKQKHIIGETTHEETNLKFEAIKGLFNKTQKLYVHANTVKQMLVALDFVKEFGFDVVIVGGSDSWQIADLLKQNNVSVILISRTAFQRWKMMMWISLIKQPPCCKKQECYFLLSDDDGQTRGRNLAFNAGTAATYGLTKEEALAAITLNAAKIMGLPIKPAALK